MSMQVPRHLVVAASGWVARAVGAGAQLFMIRLLTSHLGTLAFAVFAILYGLVGWFQLADLGVGASLQNFISESKARGVAHAQTVRAVTELSCVLFCIQALVLTVVSGWIGPWILRQFDIPNASKVQLFMMTSILLLTFSLGQVATRIYYAEKRGYIPNLTFAGAQLLGCLLAWCSIRFVSAPNLSFALGAFLLPSALFMTSLFIAILFRRTPGPSATLREVKPILRHAGGFAGFFLSGAFVLQSDVVIISQFLEPREIAQYTLLSKILALIFMLYSEGLQALWPLVTEHFVARDIMVIRKWVAAYLISGTTLIVAACVALYWQGDKLLSLLAPGACIRITLPLLGLFGAYYLIRVWCDIFGMLLQSISKLATLWIIVPIQGALCVGLEWSIVPKYGAPGVVTALALSFLLTVAWALPLAVKREVLRMKSLPFALESK